MMKGTRMYVYVFVTRREEEKKTREKDAQGRFWRRVHCERITRQYIPHYIFFKYILSIQTRIINK